MSMKHLVNTLHTRVFPSPPLKFRTAGFPQYGFKWDVSCDLRQPPDLYATQAMAFGSVASSAFQPNRQPVALPSRGPSHRGRVVLSHPLNRYYDLICASSPLSPIYVLDGESLPNGWCEEGPHFQLPVSLNVPSSVPRWIERVQLAVYFPTRTSLRRFSTGSASTNPRSSVLTRQCFEAAKFA